MGARVTVYNRRRIAGEPAGDLEVRSADLVATTVLGAEVPLAIDELPLFALAASCAHGNSRLRGAEELRAKESDRVEATRGRAPRPRPARARQPRTASGSAACPTRPRGGRIQSRGDHRIAMLGAIAALASQQGVEIEDAGVRRSKLSRASSSSSIRSAGRPPHDRRHRRARRGRQELGRPGARGPARLPLPRHGRDVSRAHLARAAAGNRARRRARPWRSSRARTPSSSTPATASRSPATT